MLDLLLAINANSQCREQLLLKVPSSLLERLLLQLLLLLLLLLVVVVVVMVMVVDVVVVIVLVVCVRAVDAFCC